MECSLWHEPRLFTRGFSGFFAFFDGGIQSFGVSAPLLQDNEVV